MKNIFVALALFFALGASAQVKKTQTKATPVKAAPVKELTSREAAEKDFEALNAFVKIEESLKPNMVKLFETKHRDLKGNSELSEDRKAILSNHITARLEEYLGTEKFAKVKANTKLFNKLTK
ncbi:MAG: hypothetical protein EOO46_15490 [Flavobacterium sp.]|nr:MAG: hypothetical protein EOO46_15490 [Flavobacterium sp.]